MKPLKLRTVVGPGGLPEPPLLSKRTEIITAVVCILVWLVLGAFVLLF